MRRGTKLWIAAGVVAAGMWAGPAEAALIDVPLPPFADPPSPWFSRASQPVVTFQFMTSWDGIVWTQAQKDSFIAGASEIDNELPLNTIVVQSPTERAIPDFTARWAGADFFKNWRNTGSYSHPGWAMGSEPYTDSNANGRWDPGEPFTDENGNGSYNEAPLAVAYKHNNGPWDRSKFPNNEIYVNSAYPWSFDPNTVDPNSFDLRSVLMHEIMHMLACDDHASHENEVMYESIGKGVRKTIQDSDRAYLRGAGYTVIPEPSAAFLMLMLPTLLRRR
jgi:hypothetical protein